MALPREYLRFGNRETVHMLFPNLRIEALNDYISILALILFGERTATLPLRIGLVGRAPLEAPDYVEICCGPVSRTYDDAWKAVEVTKLIEQKCGVCVRVFVNRELRCSHMYVENAFIGDGAEARALGALLPQAAPWMFATAALTDWEKELCTSLLAARPASAEDKIKQYFEERSFFDAKLKQAQIRGFVDGLLEAKLSALKLQEATIHSLILEAEQKHNELMAEQHSIALKILGVRAEHRDSSLEDFVTAFVANPNCQVVAASGASLTIAVAGTITNHNESTYRVMAREKNSPLYPTYCDASLLQLVWDELFLKDRYRIQCSGAISIRLDGGYVEIVRGEAGNFPNAMPNPHMYHYACAGGFKAMYREAMERNDCADVLDIAFSEVKNINWADSTVVGHFAQDVLGYWRNKACIWDKDEKVFITPQTLMDRVGGAENA